MRPISKSLATRTSGEVAAIIAESRTVLGVERRLKGLSINDVSAATNIPIEKLCRVEQGLPDYLYGDQTRALRRLFDKSIEALRKPADSIAKERLI